MSHKSIQLSLQVDYELLSYQPK